MLPYRMLPALVAEAAPVKKPNGRANRAVMHTIDNSLITCEFSAPTLLKTVHQRLTTMLWMKYCPMPMAFVSESRNISIRGIQPAGCEVAAIHPKGYVAFVRNPSIIGTGSEECFPASFHATSSTEICTLRLRGHYGPKIWNVPERSPSMAPCLLRDAKLKCGRLRALQRRHRVLVSNVDEGLISPCH